MQGHDGRERALEECQALRTQVMALAGLAGGLIGLLRTQGTVSPERIDTLFEMLRNVVNEPEMAGAASREGWLSVLAMAQVTEKALAQGD